MNMHCNQRMGFVITRKAGAWGMAAAIALGVGGLVKSRALAQPAAKDNEKSIFDFDDAQNPNPKPPTLVKPAPATTPPATPPATNNTPPAPAVPAIPEPPAPVT